MATPVVLPPSQAAPMGRRCGTALLAVLLLLLVLAACGPAQTPSLEERAQALDRTLMCPVCPGETIDQSQAQLAREMKAIVRQKLAAGESEEDIRAFFVARYGESVLAAPPARGFHLLGWLTPPLALIAGALVLVLVLRSMRRGPAEAPVPAAGPSELDSYLAAVDRELAMDDPRGAEGQRRAGAADGERG